MWRFLSHREYHIPFVTFWLMVLGVILTATVGAPEDEWVLYGFAASGIVLGTALYVSIKREQLKERKAMN